MAISDIKSIFVYNCIFGQPVSPQDVENCFSKSTAAEQSLLYDRFGGNYDEKTELDNFNTIAPLMNKEEENTTSGDSLRRWTEEHLQQIMTILNGSTKNRKHTKETIKFLLEQH